MITQSRYRGIVSVMAMLFIVVFSALAAAMAVVSQGNLRTAETYQRFNRALAAAETGMKFASYRIDRIAQGIVTEHGEITPARADEHWTTLREAILNEMDQELHSLEPIEVVSDNYLILGRIPAGQDENAPTFQVHIQRHPLAGENYSSSYYKRSPYDVGNGDNRFTIDGEPVSATNPVTRVWVRVRVVGRDGGYSRAIQMDFRLDKKIRFAMLSRNRIMVGRNVVIRGTVGSRYTLTNYKHGHPVQMRNDFHGLDGQLDTWLDSLRNYMIDNDTDGDNRIQLADDNEASALSNAESYDRNGDGYVDAYDMFLRRYDGSEDGQLTQSEFTGTDGSLVDKQLWRLINEIKYPPGTEFDWGTMSVKRPSDSQWVDASDDLSVIDNDDRYAKIAGEVMLEATRASWENGAADGTYQDYLEGPIHPDPGETPLEMGKNLGGTADFTAADFQGAVNNYKDKTTGPSSGEFSDHSQVTSPTPVDSNLEPTYTPPGAGTIEAVPYKSAHPYDYYKRPVYENYVFENVRIPKGTNAVFKNCKFVGVTFVETEVDNNDPNFNYAGMINPDGSPKYEDITATVDGKEVNDTKAHGNNIRFDDCTFEGVVSSDAPKSYAHVRNKIQFTGQTRFDLNSDNLTEQQRQEFRKSTIMAPQYSVEMGSFTDPDSLSERVNLEGTIVSGVFDVRGTATIDGSILSTYQPDPGQGPLERGGNPASFNTTIGYFGSDAGDGEAEMPTGGRGKILVRYDPGRAMPDGIAGPIEVRPAMATYHEGGE